MSVNNYRPVSVLPVFSKIYEKIVYKRLYDYIVLHNILYDNQFGFREKHSSYTPGQKFIEFFFNELLHQDNWWNTQFVNAGMETHHISTNLWNVIGAGAMASVQCP